MLAELFQPTHLLLLGLLLLLFFGGRWFAQFGNGFRAAVKNFKNTRTPQSDASTSDRKKDLSSGPSR